MKNYKKIPFNRIKDIESYIERKLKRGHIIIQILVNEDNKEIDELISYANDKGCESFFGFFADTVEQQKNSVIVERMEPYYAFKKDDIPDNVMCCDIDYGSKDENIISFYYLKKDFASMQKYYDEKSFQYPDYEGRTHYEFYISNGKGDVANMGCGMEVDFATEWMTEMGYYSK